VRVWAATVALVSVMLSAAACGGEGESGREADPETTRAATEETTAETTRAREETSPEETTQAGAPVEVSNTLCKGFSTQERAQDYLDGPRPMPEERPQLDPDGNGIACDEPDNAVVAETPQPYEVARIGPGTTAYQGPQAAAVVFTDVPEDGLQDIANEIYAGLQQYDMLSVQFYPVGAEESFATMKGLRHVYRSPEVEAAFMADMEQGVDEIIQEQCASWTAEEPPPPEWNCPQY
jgi:hypothetical protein